MTGLITPGSTVWVTPNTNPKAKLDWRWELASQDGNLVSINTVRPNGLVFDWITQGEIPSYPVIKMPSARSSMAEVAP